MLPGTVEATGATGTSDLPEAPGVLPDPPEAPDALSDTVETVAPPEAPAFEVPGAPGGTPRSPPPAQPARPAGAASRAEGPTSGLVSHFPASRNAVARVRRMPRVRWKPSIGHGLGQGLEEVLDAVAPHRIDPRLLAGVHQHFVHQDQRRESLRLRLFEKLHEERLGRRGLAFLVPALAVDCAQPLRARELERQHTPGVAERARSALRCAHALDAPLHVGLVEAERRDERARQAGADVLAELPHRGEIGQRLRVPEQVVEGDQGMGLAAAVSQLELPHRLVALPRQPPGDVPRELPQRVGRVGEREELLRLLVDRAAALPESHLVEIGSELREGKLAGAELFLEADDPMPGLRLVLLRYRAGFNR